MGAPHTYLDMVFASYVMVDGVAVRNKYVLERVTLCASKVSDV